MKAGVCAAFLVVLAAALAYAQPAGLEVPPGYEFNRVFRKCEDCPVLGFEIVRPRERITCVLGTQDDLDRISVDWTLEDGTYANFTADEARHLCILGMLRTVPAGGSDHVFWRFEHNLFYLNSDCVQWSSLAEVREKMAVSYKDHAFRFNSFFEDYAPGHVRFLLEQKPDRAAGLFEPEMKRASLAARP